MIRSIASAATLASLAIGTSASSQTTCGSDTACLVREAVMSVLIKDEFQPSIAAASIVTVCHLTDLKAATAAAVAAADAQAETQVRTAVAAALASVPSDAAGPLIEKAVDSVKLGREAQAIGHAAGLDAFLREYPRIRTDFCAMAERNVSASLTPSPH